tara:strand:+ start:1722 stop:1850 length:129 start_codon:yes stop_codon:yes gene_type:complete
MGKLINTTTIVSVMVAMVVYFMVVAPMLVKKAPVVPAVVPAG